MRGLRLIFPLLVTVNLFVQHLVKAFSVELVDHSSVAEIGVVNSDGRGGEVEELRCFLQDWGDVAVRDLGSFAVIVWVDFEGKWLHRARNAARGAEKLNRSSEASEMDRCC